MSDQTSPRINPGRSCASSCRGVAIYHATPISTEDKNLYSYTPTYVCVNMACCRLPISTRTWKTDTIHTYILSYCTSQPFVKRDMNSKTGVADIRRVGSRQIDGTGVNEFQNRDGISTNFNCRFLKIWIKHYRFNPLKTKRRPLYLKTQYVPRCKHFSSGL